MLSDFQNYISPIWEVIISPASRKIRGRFTEDPRKNSAEDTNETVHRKGNYKFSLWSPECVILQARRKIRGRSAEDSAEEPSQAVSP